MAWKQDLAKLKQHSGQEVPGPPVKPAPKPIPKPEVPLALDDEDAVFLSAMGKKPGTRAPKPLETQESPAPSPPGQTPVPETFQAAIRELKGLKPMIRGLQDRPIAVPTPTPIKGPPPLPPEPLPKEVAAEVAAETEGAPPRSVFPVRFQLAAGMALEVDGSLDLRGHSLSDAMDRLKDRLGDGLLLRWRSLQVMLGPDQALHDGLIELLHSGQAPMVSRYAQAPVPMGGTQAWLLYFGTSPAQP